MAKPIRATPTLKGEDAKKFMERMRRRENSPISRTDKALFADIERNRKYFESFLN